MHVQLYQVEVHVATTRRYLVPVYDIQVIKAIWGNEVRNKSDKGYGINVLATGMTQFRSLHDERNRMNREYGSQVRPGVTAFQSVFPVDEMFESAYQHATAEGMELFNKAEEAKRAKDARLSAPAKKTKE